MVALVVEIVLLSTSHKGLTHWSVLLIPLGFILVGLLWMWTITKGSYYRISNYKLSIYLGFILSEEVFVNSIYRIDQDSESFAHVYRATFIETGRTSLRIRIKNGRKRIVVAPINQKLFISTLLKTNPKIEIDIKYKE